MDLVKQRTDASTSEDEDLLRVRDESFRIFYGVVLGQFFSLS
jgi:hypothetical protein